MAMWHSGLRRKTGNPEVVGTSAAGDEKLAVCRTFSEQSYKSFYFWPCISTHSGDLIGYLAIGELFMWMIVPSANIICSIWTVYSRVEIVKEYTVLLE